ncbi:hypothetical protein TNCV_1317761 [Trichonephila clavipes]|nr:hypothetical protein TNCV_1317761 [Trichonephila clavipes]
MTNRKTGLLMTLFLLTLPKNNINKDIFNMTELCYLKIKVEPLRPKIGPGQCFAARDFSTRPNTARGIRSASSAVSLISPGVVRRRQQRRQPAVIARPTPPPVRAAHPSTTTPPPVRAAHPSATTPPPVSAAPASVPTPPPVSAASVPRPRPAPTPSTSHTSTPAINSTSSTSNPPSTIADTLKQLREPKVVEIFQVLKQVIAICNSDMPLADRAIEVAALLQIDLPI